MFDDEEFLELVLELAEEGIQRCERWERKNGCEACMKQDLLALANDAELRLDIIAETGASRKQELGARGGWTSLLDDIEREFR